MRKMVSIGMRMCGMRMRTCMVIINSNNRACIVKGLFSIWLRIYTTAIQTEVSETVY